MWPRMRRYHFHLRVGGATILDHNGLELGDLEEACKEATHRYWLYAQRVPLKLSAIILDDETQTMMELTFNDGEGSNSSPAVSPPKNTVYGKKLDMSGSDQ